MLSIQAGDEVTLEYTWIIGERIDGGGFGQVYTASGQILSEAVAKFVPNSPGADRELLFANPEGAENVVPIVDSGAHGEFLVIVMPRADRSLRKHFGSAQQGLPVEEAVHVLENVSSALASLDGEVVHRDLKPENILLLEDSWCLADFGISRYAEATTSPDTQKYSLSPPYAAPERWRFERATPATDVYSVGVIGFELLTGRLPFTGSTQEDYREAHLFGDPPSLDEAPAPLAALIEECLFKAPGSRPTPANLLARLRRLAKASSSGGRTRLAEAHRAEVRRRGEAERLALEAQTEQERRGLLADAARRTYEQITGALLGELQEAAPTAAPKEEQALTGLQLGQARLRVSVPRLFDGDWAWEAPAFDVICYGWVSLDLARQRSDGYGGRAHSLWYCDAREPGRFAWYETAFMMTPIVATAAPVQAPFALDPGDLAAKAVWTGVAETQVAWPFTELVVGELDEFIDRWADWFGAAATGSLGHPSRLPERSPNGSWRRE